MRLLNRVFCLWGCRGVQEGLQAAPRPSFLCSPQFLCFGMFCFGFGAFPRVRCCGPRVMRSNGKFHKGRNCRKETIAARTNRGRRGPYSGSLRPLGALSGPQEVQRAPANSLFPRAPRSTLEIRSYFEFSGSPRRSEEFLGVPKNSWLLPGARRGGSEER